MVAGSVATGGIARVNDTVKAGRKTRVESGGPDSYQFGDVTRGVLAKGRAKTNRTEYKFGDFSKVSLCSVHYYTPEGDYHWPYNIYLYLHPCTLNLSDVLGTRAAFYGSTRCKPHAALSRFVSRRGWRTRRRRWPPGTRCSGHRGNPAYQRWQSGWQHGCRTRRVNGRRLRGDRLGQNGSEPNWGFSEAQHFERRESDPSGRPE